MNTSFLRHSTNNFSVCVCECGVMLHTINMIKYHICDMELLVPSYRAIKSKQNKKINYKILKMAEILHCHWLIDQISIAEKNEFKVFSKFVENFISWYNQSIQELLSGCFITFAVATINLVDCFIYCILQNFSRKSSFSEFCKFLILVSTFTILAK